jgi:diphthine synthase
MVLYFVGLGLGDYKDITFRGLEIVKRCAAVYLESYTSILSCGKAQLEEFYGRPLIEADRLMVESGCDEMLERAHNEEVALLVVGDPFGATTHSDLYLRAAEQGIKVDIVHNASILTAVGCTGLQLYRFGETVSIPLFTENWRPTSFYPKIKQNRTLGLHTLLLLDIKVKEQSIEAMMKGRNEFLPPRFMTADEACRQLLEAEEAHKEGIISPDSLIIAALRLGSSSQSIVIDTVLGMSTRTDLGGPLHSLVLPGELHPIESEMLDYFKRATSKVS